MKTVIDFTKSCIEVSDLSNVGGDMFFNYKLFGCLPRCRKSQLLTDMPIPGGFKLRPLFGGSNASEVIPTEEFKSLLKMLPVKPSITYRKQITEEIEKQAYGSIDKVCGCPAVQPIQKSEIIGFTA
jgi:hypothetical protein